MNDDTTCEIDNAPLQEQSVGMPCHVGKWTIDHHEEENHEKHIARKAHTLGKRTSDKRRGNDGKLHLKQGIEGQGDGGSAKDLARRSGIYIATHIIEHQERRGVAYHSAYVIAKAE